MFYFKKIGDTIEKYTVTFCADRINDLRSRIINDCSIISHKDYESMFGPSNFELIRNYHEEFVCYRDSFGSALAESIYHYTYDLLQPPKLVSYIDDLLNGKVQAIDDIYTYEDFNNISFDDEINNLNLEIINTRVENIKERKEILDELQELLKMRELNKDQKCIKDYYDELLSLITFDLVDTLSIYDMKRVESFFDTKIKKVLISETPFILSLTNKKDQ